MKINPHGGDVFAAARTLGARVEELIDFSANINPSGFPEGVREAIIEALPLLRHYPDPRCVELVEAIARQKGLTRDQVLVGNGSTELIYLVARSLKPRKAMIVAPAFCEYERALELAGAETVFHLTFESTDFTLTKPPLTDGCQLVFLANPGNPSGTVMAPDILLNVLETFESRGIWTILDEAFIDFVDEASMTAHLKQFPHLVILRSFTKFYGLPGLRLGCVLADEKVIDRFLREAEPWSVNVMAQAAGLVCFKDSDYAKKTRALVDRERARLIAELSRIEGLKVFPGRANYLLVKISQPGWTASRLKDAMTRHNILIRDAGNFQGLDERFFRVAVRLPEENKKLVQAAKICLSAP